MSKTPQEGEGTVWFDPFVAFAALLGVLSFSHLVSKAYHVGFGPILRGLLASYEVVLAQVALVFEPTIHRALQVIRSLISWDLHLFGHWKHVFVLLNVYFAARYTSAFKRRQWGAAWLMVLTGFACATLAAIGAGTAPLSAGVEQVRPNILTMTLPPTVGILVFDVVEIVWTSMRRLEEMRKATGIPDLTKRQAFIRLLGSVGLRFFGALALIALVIALSYLPIGLSNIPSPGLTALLALTFLMGLYWLYQGAITAGPRRSESDTWLEAFLRVGSTRVGWAILRYMLLGTLTVLVGWWLWDAHGIG